MPSIRKNKARESKTEGGNWKIDWGRQGRVIFAYIIVFFGYYGIIVNLFMFNPTAYPKGYNWSKYLEIPEIVKGMLFWTHQYFIPSFALPWLILFLVCFWITYKEDIAHYGIRASLWLVPFIIFEGFLFYTIMFGSESNFNPFEPFIYLFVSIQGYINLLILFGINMGGALSGMLLKNYVVTQRET